jgi:HK97 family phage major capsid protein
MRLSNYKSGAVWLGIVVVAIAVFSAVPHDAVAQSVSHVGTFSILGGAGLIPFIGPTIAEKKKALAQLFVELETAQKEMSEGKELPANRGEEIEAKAKEAEALQKEIDKYDRIARLAEKGKELDPDDEALPETESKSLLESKRRGGSRLVAADGSPIEGVMSIGTAFVLTKEFEHYRQNGIPAPGVVSQPVMVKGLREPMIPVSRKFLEDEIVKKAIATVGADVIQPMRIAEVVRTTENDRLTFRDLLQVAPTTSNAIEYVVIADYTRAAAGVAEAAGKPEATMEIDTATTPVRTLAVWMPVTEQQLQDVPALRSMIDNELLYDLEKTEEEQIAYGSGAGQNLQGLLTLAGIPSVTRDAPDAATTQNLDRIRIAITDIMTAGFNPNGVAIHPIDWEGIVLLKGTDERYIWAMIPTDNGPRVWGIDVVESVGMKNPANLQRHFLVGDFIRGATLYDREQANVAVGFINDQFIKNMRTVRAEERVALAIKRPLAFEKYETRAAV